jgi:hypothetical protein
MVQPKLRFVTFGLALLVGILLNARRKKSNLPARVFQFQSYGSSNHGNNDNIEDSKKTRQHERVNVTKPHHNGYVHYSWEISDDSHNVYYERDFNVPCGYGVLVFNVGPAAEYEPYPYDLYEDAFAYSNNDGLCLLYPSYAATQTSTYPFWSFENNDAMEMTVPLGDAPTRISSRVVVVPNSKPYNRTETTYRGGDYVIMRDGNFYSPRYFKTLKQAINSWPLVLSTTTLEESVTTQWQDLLVALEKL